MTEVNILDAAPFFFPQYFKSMEAIASLSHSLFSTIFSLNFVMHAIRSVTDRQVTKVISEPLTGCQWSRQSPLNMARLS